MSIIDDAAKLQWMQSTWAGVNVLFSDTSKRDYVCTRIAGIFGALTKSVSRHRHPSVGHAGVCCLVWLDGFVLLGFAPCWVTGPLMAEYVLGYVLLLERKLLVAKSQQEAKVRHHTVVWSTVLQPHEPSVDVCPSVSVVSRRGWKSHSRRGRAHLLG